MQSMTGYGKGVSADGGRTITVEVKTVNHRFLDWGLKLPKTFLFLEDTVKKTVGTAISRGHIDIFLTFEQSSVKTAGYVADIELAKSYVEAARELQSATGLDDDFSLSALLRAPDVMTRANAPEDEELLKALTETALGDALKNLKIMRAKEGESLYYDINEKLDNIGFSLDKIKTQAPNVTAEYRDRLNARIAEAVQPGLADETRLATEIALYADKCAIDEEITRLGAHIDNMRVLMNESEPVGRKLDFLVQELNREANTIGSKANDLKITSEVLKIKNEIEKIREQAQNIE